MSEQPRPFTPDEERAERAYIAEYVSDPLLKRWIATLDALRAALLRTYEGYPVPSPDVLRLIEDTLGLPRSRAAGGSPK